MPEYFTLAELRALPDMGDTARYTDARVEAVAGAVVGIVESTVGTSFVSRTFTEVHDGTRVNRSGRGLVLRQRFAQSVTALSQDGVAFTAAEIDELDIVSGVLERAAAGTFTPLAWTGGRRNITVTYTAGYSTTPPSDVKEAALVATRYRLLTTDGKSGASDRATSVTNEFGNVQMAVATEDHPFGLPEVDAVVMRWRKRVRTPLIA